MLRLFESCRNTQWNVLSVFVILVFVGFVSDVQSISFADKIINNTTSIPHEQLQVIIIDAGSTGSRAYLYTLSLVKGKPIIDNEFVVKTVPGLNTFGKQPENVSNYLKRLLSKIQNRIPKEKRSHTPVLLYATAGLRLLPGEEAEAILSESRHFLHDSGFKIDKDSVKIITGLDESLFVWLALNFITDRLFDSDDARTVAALDLGGASAQLTFDLTPVELKNIAETTLNSNAEYLKHIEFFGHDYTVFTRSFLGLGIMAARHAILLHPDNNKLDNQGEKLNRSSETLIELRAECINPIDDSIEWRYNNKNYLISGPLKSSSNSTGFYEKDPVDRFFTCLDIIRKVVKALVPKDLPKVTKQIYGFSTYILTAMNTGLVDPVKGGVIPLKSVYEGAAKACQDPNKGIPFACLDLSFIYVLLREGFDIDDTTTISLYPKINGYEANWAVGAAFNALGYVKKRNFKLTQQ